MIYLYSAHRAVIFAIAQLSCTLSETGEKPVMLQTVSFVVGLCLVYGFLKFYADIMWQQRQLLTANCG